MQHKSNFPIHPRFIRELEPQTDAGKKLVVRGLSAVKYFENQVEMGRVSLADLAGKLAENPDDTKSISMYLQKLMMEASPLTRTVIPLSKLKPDVLNLGITNGTTPWKMSIRWR